jgi:nitrite reductase/ring-hydroxylating ferredoxin subunit
LSKIVVANVNDIPVGGKKRVVVGGTAILLSNVGGEIHATSDRCGHMNASLYDGTLDGLVVTCAFHGSQFDLRTGEVVRGPQVAALSPELIKEIPEQVLAIMRKGQEITARIEVMPLDIYKVEVKGESVYIDDEPTRSAIKKQG